MIVNNNKTKYQLIVLPPRRVGFGWAKVRLTVSLQNAFAIMLANLSIPIYNWDQQMDYKAHPS